MADC